MRDDTVSLPRIQTLHPVIRNEAIIAVNDIEKQFPQNIKIRITQALRSEAEQNLIYSLGRTVKNPNGATAARPMGAIVSDAKFGQSFHNYGLALDFCLMYLVNDRWVISWDDKADVDRDKIADWQEVVTYFKGLGWTWGGDFKKLKDAPHLQKDFGIPWRLLFDRYARREWIDTGKYVYLI